MEELSKVPGRLLGQLKATDNDSAAVAALNSCRGLLALAMDHLNGSYS